MNGPVARGASTPAADSAGAAVEPPYASARRGYKVIVVLPVYNEEENIGRLLERIDEQLNESLLPYRIVAVDDGSKDRSLAILEERSRSLPIQIFRHAVNQGLGAAIRDGLMCAGEIAGDRDIVVTMDADNTHTPGLIPRMVRMIREGHDVVIASRYERGGMVCGLTVERRMVSWVASWVMRVLFPTRGVRDYTCGYRAYRVEVLKAAWARYGDRFVDQQGFQCMLDILLKLRRMPLIFGEVPMVLRYDFKRGASKMRIGRTAYHTLRVMFQRRLGR